MPVTLPMIVHRPPKQPPKPRPVLSFPTQAAIEERINEAAKKFGCDPALVMTKTRKRDVCRARQYVLATLTTEYKLRLHNASLFFGYDRDTIRNAKKNVLKWEVTARLEASGLI